ncbi:MAG TPA: ester cyclase, partial [bacterium]|nr:ester cyclase [bacterium]
MSEESKAVVRKFYVLLDKGDLGGVSQLLSDNLVWHFAGIPAPFDKQSFTGFLQAFRLAFPDMQHSLDPQIAEGDRVVTSLTFRATHRGELQGIPASGKRVEIRALN